MGGLCMDKKNRVEIQDFKEWTAGVYLIEAGCGQGKNYFVFNTLFHIFVFLSKDMEQVRQKMAGVSFA